MQDIETLINRLTDRQLHEFALACARRVQHLMRDPRSIAALDTKERWLRGEATDEEMGAARDAASAAAWAAARDSTLAAERAARAAVRAADGAALAAVRAADGAALAAVWAAEEAARAAARAAVGDAERAWQREELERMLGEGGGA